MSEKIGDFAGNIAALKRKDRAGWVLRGIKNPESVAEHSFGTGWLAYALAPSFGFNPEHCAMLGFVHDFAEAKVPDYTPRDNISPEEKFRQEEAAMIDICKEIPNGQAMLKLWYEIEKEETPEGRFVKQMDKLEMMFQAHEYGIEQPEIDLQEFWDSADKYDFEQAAEIYRKLRDGRNK